MAENSRNTSILLLICALTGAMVFFGCGGGGTSSDPIPVRTYQITGKIVSGTALSSILSAEASLRGAENATNVEVYIEDNRSLYSTTTDENGNFSLTVPEGTHVLIARITTSSGKVYKVRSGQVTVSRTQPTAEISSLQLIEANSRISGIVKNSAGNPIANARLTLWGETFYTDASGKFTTPPMPDGISADIKFATTGYQETIVNAEFDADNPLYIEQTIVGQSATNRAPTVTMRANNYELTTGQSSTITTTASDPDGDSLTYTWTSTSGRIATQSSGASAVWTAPDVSALATVSVKVSDPAGLSATSFITIKVGSGNISTSNHSPVVTSIETANSTFMNNAQYELTAIATDSDGDALTYFWSTAKGSVNPTDLQTTTWTTPNITGTEYIQVTVLVSDGKGGSNSRTATYTVSTDPNPPPNQAPTANITSPANSSLFNPGTISYAGTGIDPEEGELSGNNFVWLQNKEGEPQVLIGNQRQSLTLQLLDPATYVVELQVTDILGAEGKAVSRFRINANPFAHITSPANHGPFQLGQAISFTGIGTDVEDISIPATNLTWWLPGGSTATGSTVTSSNLGAGTQTVQLSAIDSLGKTSSKDAIQVYINTPPKINSISPASGTVYLTGQTIPFAVNINDVDEIIASSGIVWRRGVTTLGTGYNLEVTTLNAGINNIDVTVSDSMGGSVSSTTQVVVNQRPTMTITNPANNAVVQVNRQFTFTGTGSSIFGNVSSATMVWQDNYMMATSTIGVSRSSLPYTYDNSELGKHIITLSGNDTYGASSYTQHIIYVNATPSVTIASPASGTRFDSNAPITFASNKSDPDPSDVLNIRWLDGATQVGTGDSFTTSSLASGNHNIFCEVSDQHGITSLASISVFVNTLPTGTINISNTQYATAPGNIPVFMSTTPNLELSFSVDSSDFEIGGPIQNYNPEHIRWYTNTGSGYVSNGTGSTLIHSLPLGSSTIKVELFDSFYPEFPAATESGAIIFKSLHIWQSVDFNEGTSPMLTNTVSLHGSGLDLNPTLYLTFNENPAKVRQIYFDGSRPNGKLTEDFTYAVSNASYPTFTNGFGSVPFENKVILLGLDGANQTLLPFTSGDPTDHGPLFTPTAGLNNATSIDFNSQSTNQKMAYAANQGDLIAFDSEDGTAINNLTEANSKAFGNLLRVRFSKDFGSASLGNLFVADPENNRVVMMEAGLTNPTSLMADSPIDVAFTKNMIMTLSDTTKEISLIDPVNEQLLMKFGGTGAGPGKFTNPTGIFCSGYDLFIIENGKMQLIRSGMADWLKD
jgi:hypothetical protein